MSIQPKIVFTHRHEHGCGEKDVTFYVEEDKENHSMFEGVYDGPMTIKVKNSWNFSGMLHDGHIKKGVFSCDEKFFVDDISSKNILLSSHVTEEISKHSKRKLHCLFVYENHHTSSPGWVYKGSTAMMKIKILDDDKKNDDMNKHKVLSFYVPHGKGMFLSQDYAMRGEFVMGFIKKVEFISKYGHPDFYRISKKALIYKIPEFIWKIDWNHLTEKGVQKKRKTI